MLLLPHDQSLTIEGLGTHELLRVLGASASYFLGDTPSIKPFYIV
jgi:hypothetical protein